VRAAHLRGVGDSQRAGRGGGVPEVSGEDCSLIRLLDLIN
jgi:hypothetical protein